MSQCFFPKTQQSTYSNTFIQGTASYIAPPSDSKTQPTTGHCLMTRVRGVATSLFIIVISPFEMLFNGAKFVGKTLIGVVTINLEQIKNAWKKEGKETYIGFSRTILFPFVLIISAIHAKIWLTINESTNGKLTPAPLKGRTATASKEKSSYHPSRHHSKCSKIKELKENLAKAQTTATTIQSALEHRMLTLEREKKELEDQLRAAQEEARERFPVVPTIVVPQERIRELEAQLTEKTNGLATAQTQAQKNETEINKLKKIIEDKEVNAKTTQDLLKIEIEGLNQAIRNLERQITNANTMREQLQEELNEKTSKIHELKTELDEREKQHLESINNLKRILHQTHLELENAKCSPPTLPTRPSLELETLEARLREKESELEFTRQTVNEKNSLLKNHETELLQLNQKILDLQKQINAPKKPDPELTAKVKELETALISKRKEMEALECSLSGAKSDQRLLEMDSLHTYKALKTIILEITHSNETRDFENALKSSQSNKITLERTYEEQKIKYNQEKIRISNLDKIPDDEGFHILTRQLFLSISSLYDAIRLLSTDLTKQNRLNQELDTSLKKINEDVVIVNEATQKKLFDHLELQKSVIAIYLALKLSRATKALQDLLRAKLEKQTNIESSIKTLKEQIETTHNQENPTQKKLIEKLELALSDLKSLEEKTTPHIQNLEEECKYLNRLLVELGSVSEPKNLPISLEEIMRDVTEKVQRFETQRMSSEQEFDRLNQEYQNTIAAKDAIILSLRNEIIELLNDKESILKTHKDAIHKLNNKINELTSLNKKLETKANKTEATYELKLKNLREEIASLTEQLQKQIIEHTEQSRENATLIQKQTEMMEKLRQELHSLRCESISLTQEKNLTAHNHRTTIAELEQQLQDYRGMNMVLLEASRSMGSVRAQNELASTKILDEK